jgi:hypothetical protein
MINMQYFKNTFIDPAAFNFDASMGFQPNWAQAPSRLFGSWKDKLMHKLNIRESIYVANYIAYYKDFVAGMMETSSYNYKCYPSVTPGWDNSARKKRKGAILLDSTPQLFSAWLEDVLKKFKPYSKEENFIFINAWNEWAEGNHLEPCQKWGRAYLEAFRDTLQSNHLTVEHYAPGTQKDLSPVH